MPVYAFAIIEFLTPFSSYSPTLPEGYLDSTTLHAVFIAVESEVLGNPNPNLARDDVLFSSLLPTGISHEDPVPLLPPLRVPVLGGKAWGFWTPKAARKILELIEKCGNGNSFLAYNADNKIYDFVCGEKWSVRGILYDSERKLFYVEGEDVSFQPPQLIDERTRMVLDRITQAATPYLAPSVIARSHYWFMAKLPSGDLCEWIREALRAMRYVGLGAYRSSGFGRIRTVRIDCFESKDLLSKLSPVLASKNNNGELKISLGLLLPDQSSCKVHYGRILRFGEWRGFAGRIVNFRRPLVTSLAPGSVVLTRGDSCGRAVYSRDPPPFYYSFNPLLFPI